jgi:murein DD-endopeptidase MepM/ murein hydrolase activator NlpD
MKDLPRRTLVDNLRLFTVAVAVALLVGLVTIIGHNRSSTVAMLGTATPTNTATPTPTYSPTPTNTATPTPTYSPTPTATPTSSPTTVLTATLGAEAISSTATATATPAGTPTLTLTPTPTPTPVPRTVLASSLGLPDPSQAEDHFWFTRPFTQANASWGSPYYPFGTNNRGQYLWHHGIDIQNPLGTPILAVGDGMVVRAGPDDVIPFGPTPNFFGQAVLIRHDREWNSLSVYTLYGHVSKVLVQEGQPVKAGDVVAEVGQGGVALGPHLHLEVRVGGMSYWDVRNPDLWVKPDPGYSVVAGRVIDAQGYLVPQQPLFLHRAQEPDRFWRETFTYPDNVVKSDDEWGETFTFADVPAGGYILKTYFDGRLYTYPITTTSQATTFVMIEGAPFPPTPTPPSAFDRATLQPEPAVTPPATGDMTPTSNGA